MISNRIAKIVLTGVLAGGALVSFGLDWQNSHLLNPLWHPHARYHAAILLFFDAGVASTGTWLLWRSSREPDVALTTGSLLALAYWTPFFYVPSLLPTASYWAGIPGHEPRFAGIVFYPNLVAAAAFVAVTILGWSRGRTSLGRRRSRVASPQNR
jgi:hypothetical protein